MAKLSARTPPSGISIGNPVDELVLEVDGSTTSAPMSTTLPIRISPVAAFDERIDASSQAASQSFDFLLERTHDYLNWRFCDPRAGCSAVRQAEVEGRPVGYAVTSLQPEARGYIADVLGRPDIVQALLTDATEQLIASGAKTVQCWMPRHHSYRAALGRLGFRHKRRPVQMHVSAIRINESELSFLSDSHASVHITMGDTDLV